MKMPRWNPPRTRLALARCAFLMAGAAVLPAVAAELSVPMALVDAQGVAQPIGSVRILETPHGLVFTPVLAPLPPGLHGFHVHENPSCAPREQDGRMQPALAAGGHLDPARTGRHGEPWGDGHLGDLPALHVAADGSASTSVLAPRLKTLADVRQRALIVHVGGDNHADHPAPLGGGGARLACGVIGG